MENVLEAKVGLGGSRRGRRGSWARRLDLRAAGRELSTTACWSRWRGVMAMEPQWLWPHLIGEREGRSTSFSQLWTSCHVPVSLNLQNDPVKGRSPFYR